MTVPRHSHPGRQELAVAMVRGGQQPGDPGSRRLRLHPRVRRRAALPRQSAQPDPRGHPRHPEPGPVGPQGDPERRSRSRRRWGSGSSQPSRGPRRCGARVGRATRTPSWQRLVAVTGAMFASGDVEAAMANSAVYLEAFGHIVVAWIWLEQYLAAEDARATSMTASVRPRGTSSVTNCPRPHRNWTCWRVWTAPRWRCATTGSNRTR